MFEVDSTPHPIRDAMMTPELRPSDGWLAVPSGLGIDVDPSVLSRFAG